MPDSSEHGSVDRPIQEEEAREIAETMRALGSPARLRLLVALIDGDKKVEGLSDAAGLEQSATSHHLRLLRSLRLVKVRRDGRHRWYSLYDHHVRDLLAAVRHHQEHVYLPDARDLPAGAHAGRSR